MSLDSRRLHCPRSSASPHVTCHRLRPHVTAFGVISDFLLRNSYFLISGVLSRLPSILSFLTEIGLPVREDKQIPEETFLPGLCISRGTLLFDRARLTWPGDLLHEAGHLAVTPAAQRHLLDDRLSPETEAPDAGEIEATAWSFAAANYL